MTLRGGDREAARAMPRWLTGWWVADLFTEVGYRMRNRFGREYKGFTPDPTGLED